MHVHTDILPGWTVGGGVEYKYMRNWVLRGEYRRALVKPQRDQADWARAARFCQKPPSGDHVASITSVDPLGTL
jgi:hypothetical protein